MADSNAYPVRAVYEYFRMLERASELEAFLKECDEKKLTLDVGARLFSVGHQHFTRLSKPARPGEAVPEAVGPDCPLCPGPPRF